jgi:hypothetical protein
VNRVKSLIKGKGTTTVDEVIAFEHAHGVVLPESYRKAVLDLGYGLDSRNLSSLEDWCQPRLPEEMPDGFLRTPFPHHSAWNDRSQFSGGWDCPYFNVEHWAGAMRIVNLGCERYYALVVTGPERGTVWLDGRADGIGIVPLVGVKGKHADFEALLRGDSYVPSTSRST